MHLDVDLVWSFSLMESSGGYRNMSVMLLMVSQTTTYEYHRCHSASSCMAKINDRQIYVCGLNTQR